MNGDCAICESHWAEYARLASLRLAFIREQQGMTPARAPGLGRRIQLLAEAQISVRRRLSAHELEGHRGSSVVKLLISKQSGSSATLREQA